ncbi:hypothetical protein B0H16DRAFT_1519196 [Mycena metata]|uniref:Uncharacterized protein n=1 Tax=Mycena metata TaxID=1033252 RepID=A0AAD7NNA1_9AGAR|nr:hypothetical protein B0H16DRAFT_1519196 [Mycena metata]
MPSIFSRFKKIMSGKDSDKKGEEQQFSIQPHPAKTNDPADLQPPQTGGLASNPNEQAFHARDPHVPSQQVMAGLEQPAVGVPPYLRRRELIECLQSREELQARQAELNK